jgi:hypothetical protein
MDGARTCTISSRGTAARPSGAGGRAGTGHSPQASPTQPCPLCWVHPTPRRHPPTRVVTSIKGWAAPWRMEVTTASLGLLLYTTVYLSATRREQGGRGVWGRGGETRARPVRPATAFRPRECTSLNAKAVTHAWQPHDRTHPNFQATRRGFTRALGAEQKKRRRKVFSTSLVAASHAWDNPTPYCLLGGRCRLRQKRSDVHVRCAAGVVHVQVVRDASEGRGLDDAGI